MRLIIYHNDADGFASAYCAWKIYGHDKTDYMSTDYGMPIIEFTKYDELILLDFSYPRNYLEEMYELLEGKLLILDHHKSAEENLKGLDYCIFDSEKSGATLAWAYFNNYNPHIKIPELLEYVEDFDLWKFHKGEDTKRIAAALESYRHLNTFEIWDKWIEDWSFHGEKLIAEGKTIVRYQDFIVDSLKRDSYLQTWVVDGKVIDIPMVNTRQVISRTGAALARGKPFAATYYDVHGQRNWSLRSDENGWDVSEVAKMKGGGGHYHAAGFNTYDDDGPILTFTKE